MGNLVQERGGYDSHRSAHIRLSVSVVDGTVALRAGFRSRVICRRGGGVRGVCLPAMSTLLGQAGVKKKKQKNKRDDYGWKCYAEADAVPTTTYKAQRGESDHVSLYHSTARVSKLPVAERSSDS